MAASNSTLIPWRVDGPATLHGFDDDLVYMQICTDTADPELQRQVALVSAWDLEGEGYAQTIAAVPRLLAACQSVVANWEHGDLAQAARLCAEAVQTAIPGSAAAQEQQVDQVGKVRCVEYYRLWGGDSGTWDTDFIDIPADTPDDQLSQAIRSASATIKWRDEVPAMVGYYADADEREDEDEEATRAPAPPAANPEDSERTITDLASKAEAAGLAAEDFDETVHDLADSISADINNAGVADQIRYLSGEWGMDAAAREIDRLAEEKARTTAVKPQSQIRADCHSDDRVYSAAFNALPWFEQADERYILKLAREDWCDGYAADDVGIFMADLVPDVQKMFDYLEHYNRLDKEHIGWTCAVNKGDALAWLKSHRPQLYPRVSEISAAAGV